QTDIGIVLDRGDVDVDPLGKQRIVLDLWAEPLEIDRIAVVDEEHRVRVADVDRRRLLEVLPAYRQGRRVHRVGQRDRVPLEARFAHVDRRAALAGLDRERAAGRLDLRRRAVEKGDGARRVAAGFDLAAVGIEYAHAEV